MLILGGGIAVRLENNTVIAKKFLVHGWIFIGSHAKNNAVPRSDVFLQPVQARSLFDARRTPSSPKIQNHNFAVQVGKMSRLAPKLHRKIFRALTYNSCFAVPVTRQRKNHNDAQEGRQASPSQYLRPDSHRMLY